MACATTLRQHRGRQAYHAGLAAEAQVASDYERRGYPVAARRWRGALLPNTAHVRFDVVDPDKRPVMADADSNWIENVLWVEIWSEPSIKYRIMFDPGHGLEERLIREQFV